MVQRNMPENKEITRIQVSPAVLGWAIDRPERLELEKKFPKLADWISGKSGPTINQLEDFARCTNIPFGFFFLKEPPLQVLPIPYFRSVENSASVRPSDELLDTVRQVKSRQDWLREYLIDQGADKLPFVNSASVGDDAIAVAHKIRESLNIDHGWAASQKTWTDALKDLIVRVESLGIFVVSNGVVGNNTHRALDPKEFRGFVLVDSYAPIIFLNGVDSKAAQMFSIAHELAHIWLGKSAAFDLRELTPANDPIELKCNAIAAEVLVPQQELLALWKSSGKQTFDQISRHFKVSQLVAARRAADLGLITRAQFFAFYRKYLEQEFHSSDSAKSGGGNFYLTQNQRLGRLFAQTVYAAVKQNKLLYRDAYRLTGLKGKTFDTYFTKTFT